MTRTDDGAHRSARADHGNGAADGSGTAAHGSPVRSSDASAKPGTGSTVTTVSAALAGRYEIIRELGRGGMAAVYLARDERHDRAVAVKVLERDVVAPSGAERFLHEIRIAARLTHPHVLGVHDSGEAAGLLYYVMPYVQGETLRSRLSAGGPLPIADAVRLARELADGLAHAHGQGVIHRDLKPENVLLAGGHAVIADFGIARAIASVTGDAGSSAAALTSTGIAVGTPAYMAPEQAVGSRSTDHRADLYALGLIVYEMLAGAHPFGSRSAAALVAAHLTEPPPPVHLRRRDAPAGLAALVMQLLAKDPAARPESAEAVCRALDNLTLSQATHPGRRWRRASVGPMAVMLSVLGISGYGVWQVARDDSLPPSGFENGSATVRSLAVLPFANTGGDEADEYFSDGLTDELAHALLRLPDLRLAGRTSTFAFKGRAAPAQEIGRELDVDAFIAGTVRRAGDRLRVTAQLVSAVDGKVVWDSVFESRSADVFAVQDEFTRAIVAALASSLSADPGAGPLTSPPVSRGTENAEAYELFLRGRYHWLARGGANVIRAIEYYREAIALDSGFARAHAGLAQAYATLPPYFPDPTDSVRPLIEASARRALALDSTLADTQIAMGLALEGRLRFAEAEARYRVALALDPSHASTYHVLAFPLLSLGRPDEAIAVLQRATDLDPLVKSARAALALAFVNARRFAEAKDVARQVLANDSTFPLALATLGLAQLFGGEPAAGAGTLEHLLALHPGAPGGRMLLVLAYAAAGRPEDARRLRAAIDAPGTDRSRGIEPAMAALVFGDPEPLVALLSGTSGQQAWLDATATLGCNPLLDPLWSDGRFRDSMGRLGIAPCPLARPWPVGP